MAKVTPPRPTDAELEILRVLWAKGPSTVREVYEELNKNKVTGYTTVLKLMQIMSEKQLVRRDENQRAHVYQAMLPQKATQGQLVRDLVDRAFSGSAAGLVMQALASEPATPEELRQIRQLLDEYERGKK
jgi:BlaI family transcriptional regulator, penicillinase repressor